MATELDKAIAGARARWAGATPADAPADDSEMDLGAATPARAVESGPLARDIKKSADIELRSASETNHATPEKPRPLHAGLPREPEMPVSHLQAAMAAVDAADKREHPRDAAEVSYRDGYNAGYLAGRADGYREALDMAEYVTKAGFVIQRLTGPTAQR